MRTTGAVRTTGRVFFISVPPTQTLGTAVQEQTSAGDTCVGSPPTAHLTPAPRFEPPSRERLSTDRLETSALHYFISLQPTAAASDPPPREETKSGSLPAAGRPDRRECRR